MHATQLTSLEARPTRERAQSQRERLLAFLVARGSVGATDEQMQFALSLSGNTQRPRRGELVKAGLVVDAGVRLVTSNLKRAIVWVAVLPYCSCDWFGEFNTCRHVDGREAK
jgi:hypothetical protein